MKLPKSNILQNTLYQLIFIYFILILFVSLGYMSKYSYHFEYFALIIGFFSIFVTFRAKSKLNLPKWLILVPIILLLGTRLIPYADNDIPLGYDPGMYKSLFEHNHASLQDGKLEETNWGKSMHPLGVSFIINLLMSLGFSSNSLVQFGIIFFDMLIILGLYLVGREFFNKEVAIISTFFYSFSTVAFETFYLNYYKNIIGIFLILVSIYLFRKRKFFSGILTGGFLGGLHRPSFVVFGGSYLFNWFAKRGWKLFLSGILIILVTLTFYLDRIYKMITPIIKATGESLVQNTGSGTFISLDQFVFGSLLFIGLFWIGFISYIKEKRFNYLFFWATLTGIVVLFELFFYNRMIIFLNTIIIIFSSYGFYL